MRSGPNYFGVIRIFVILVNGIVMFLIIVVVNIVFSCG